MRIRQQGADGVFRDVDCIACAGEFTRAEVTFEEGELTWGQLPKISPAPIRFRLLKSAWRYICRMLSPNHA